MIGVKIAGGLEVIDKNAISSELKHFLKKFEFCVNRISVPLPTKTIKTESNKCISFLVQKLFVPIFFA